MINNITISNEAIQNKILVYSNGEIELNISVKNDMVWLNANDIAILFEVQRPAIVKHVGNIYKTNELVKDATCSILEQVAKDGKKRKVNYYNLDMIISVGYRINSIKATKFRIWATSVLKQYISNGYAINSEKITHQRFLELENDMNILKKKVNKIDSLIVSKSINVAQGIFHDGQIYDAYSFINDLLRSAKKEITLIDNYIDDSVLTLCSKYTNIESTIITKSIPKQLKLDIEKYNKQYKNLKIKILNKYHDRFLLIDNSEAYHLGASLKDLGKKVFALSKIDIELLKASIDE